MIAEATSTTDHRILSASGFTREHISILHQQIRCTNLAWALHRKRRISAGKVVVIVGGSFSGLMLAVAISLLSKAIVYIFEKEDRLLPRFRDKGHRHLSPLLNSRALGHNFDPSYATPDFSPPIFAWQKGRASDVASQWLSEFESYNRILPIFTFKRCAILKDNVKADAAGLAITLNGTDNSEPIRADILIDACGFGEEANPLRLADFSYWEGGHRLIYDHLPSPAKVLISGCGDSGVIEGLHYALTGFNHEDVEALWPQPHGPDSALDSGLEHAHLDYVLRTRCLTDCAAIPELCWWLQTHWNLEYNSHYDWMSAEPYVRPMFKAIQQKLAPQLEQAFPHRKLSSLRYEEKKYVVDGLPLETQFAIRDAVRPIADDCISNNIRRLTDKFSLPQEVATLREMMRPDCQVTLNACTPTAYSRQLSPYNVWLMKLLLSLPNVKYRRGKITTVTREARAHDFNVTFESGRSEAFDRVVTRYGASHPSGISCRNRRDIEAGDWLLDQTPFTAPDPNNPAMSVRTWVARKAIVYALDRTIGAPKKLAKSDISKLMYTKRLRWGANGWPTNDPMHADPQARLANRLKRGLRCTYDTDALIERALKR